MSKADCKSHRLQLQQICKYYLVIHLCLRQLQVSPDIYVKIDTASLSSRLMLSHSEICLISCNFGGILYATIVLYVVMKRKYFSFQQYYYNYYFRKLWEKYYQLYLSCSLFELLLSHHTYYSIVQYCSIVCIFIVYTSLI